MFAVTTMAVWLRGGMSVTEFAVIFLLGLFNIGMGDHLRTSKPSGLFRLVKCSEYW